MKKYLNDPFCFDNLGSLSMDPDLHEDFWPEPFPNTTYAGPHFICCCDAV
jgi:hypothetical protein